MKAKSSILYSWLVRTITYFLPNIPLFMRLRGFLYSFMMNGCGKDFQVASSVVLNPLSGLTVGNNVYIAHNTVVIGLAVEINDEVLIGPNCTISSGNHVFSNKSYRFGKSTIEPVKIMSGSWVAGNCTIVGGGVLPARSILAAGSVLNKRFEQDNSLYAGAPAMFKKNLINTL
nr:acyltransferase [Mucilaginibacter sp. L294]